MSNNDLVPTVEVLQHVVNIISDHINARVRHAVEAEREACANVCYTLGNDSSIDEMEYRAFREAEETIRARGEVKP